MKISLPVAVLLGLTQAIKVSSDPDVFGPNGNEYANQSAD